MMADNIPIQGSLFEENYLLRTLGSIASNPDLALTELVANAWDAGASTVKINIPDELGGILVVEDDGSGMTPDQFKKRWMTLGYDRSKHQGTCAEFPPERSEWRRRAYGRNGVGRHALLCFADSYEVQTCRDGLCSRFFVGTASGKDPFVLIDEEINPGEGHGTKLSAKVVRNIPDPNRIRTVLAGRFLSDPQFKIFVNDITVPLTELEGLIDQHTLVIDNNLSVAVLFFEIDDTSKRVLHRGIAFWVGGRLVGYPSWILGERVLLDGRTRFARRHAVVIRGDDLFDLVLSDWTAFRPGETTDKLLNAVGDYVEEKIRELAADQVHQTCEEVLRRHRDDLEQLEPLGRLEVEEIVTHITESHPTISQEDLSVAVEAVIHIEKYRSGAELLEKLSLLSEDDVEGLNRLLSEWTIRDALTVLDEIDKRLKIIEALEKLSVDPKVDELHTLHPLVTQARWLFGPEFDSPEYASNMSLINAVKSVFKKRLAREAFLNHKKRPDLIVLEDATLSVTGTESFEPDENLSRITKILIIELKRGASIISRREIHQASDYVQDLLSCGALEGTPFVYAFVVGHQLEPKTQEVERIGDPEVGRIEACTYSRLVRSANKRLFNLKDKLRERYFENDEQSILYRIFHEPRQGALFENPSKGA